MSVAHRADHDATSPQYRPGANGHDPHPAEGHQHVSHQFEDLDQQNESYVVGMWTFLVTEVMFFGALFLAYGVYKVMYPAAFNEAHRELSVPLGTFNTVVLLVSSLTMALAVHAAQQAKRWILVTWLVITMSLAGTFLVVKGFEYYDKYTHHHIPGINFQWKGVGREQGASAAVVNDTRDDAGFFSNNASKNADHAQLFFSLYFAMTGLHALHIIIGVGIMSFLVGLAAFNHASVRDYMPIEMVGLYWHFVDIVWIFLFPLLYLVG